MRADVVLLELASTTWPSQGTLRALTAACAPARALILAPSLEQWQVADALREGVCGVVFESVDASTLLSSLEAVAAGRYWLTPESMADIVRALPAAPAGPRPDPRTAATLRLTPRELEIITLVAAGDGNRDIARGCGISEKTVKHHITNIFDKLGVSSRLELAVFALEYRIVDPDRHRQ